MERVLITVVVAGSLTELLPKVQVKPLRWRSVPRDCVSASSDRRYAAVAMAAVETDRPLENDRALEPRADAKR
jgi:hypothetical protein